MQVVLKVIISSKQINSSRFTSQATHAASLHDNVICTLRVLEVILNLVDLLMDMGVLKQFLRDEALSGSVSTPLGDRGSEKSAKTDATPPAPSTEADKGSKPVTPHRMIMNIIVRSALFKKMIVFPMIAKYF